MSATTQQAQPAEQRKPNGQVDRTIKKRRRAKRAKRAAMTPGIPATQAAVKPGGIPRKLPAARAMIARAGDPPVLLTQFVHELPPKGTPATLAQRKEWAATFEALTGFSYPLAEAA